VPGGTVLQCHDAFMPQCLVAQYFSAMMLLCLSAWCSSAFVLHSFCA